MSGGAGYMVPGNTAIEHERSSFRADRTMANVRSLIPVKVMKVYKIDGTSTKTQGDVEPAGFVDVKPLISMVDGQQQKMDHGTIYHIPYVRSYGGNAAIIMDPVVGDVGYIKAADRDISSFKDGMAGGSSTSSYTPNSRRRHDMADSVYMGGLLSQAPKQYITFKSDGSVVVVDKNNNTITMNSSGVTITDKVNGNSIVMNSSGIVLTPGSGGTVQLGGSGGQFLNINQTDPPVATKVKAT